MLWNLGLFLVMVGAGKLVGSFCVSQVILCFSCALPLIAELDAMGKIDAKGAKKRTVFPIVLWSIVTVAAFVLVFWLGNLWVKIGFCIGVIFPLFIGGLQLSKRNEANVIDFICSYRDFIYDKDLVGNAMLANMNSKKQ
jgi:hypothetical protein